MGLYPASNISVINLFEHNVETYSISITPFLQYLLMLKLDNIRDSIKFKILQPFSFTCSRRLSESYIHTETYIQCGRGFYTARQLPIVRIKDTMILFP